MKDINKNILKKIINKTAKSAGNDEMPDLSNMEMTFIDNSQDSAVLLIDEIVKEQGDNNYRIACLWLLDKSISNLRYNYERNETWAKRLYSKIDKVLTENYYSFSQDSIIGIMGVFYNARLDIPEGFNALCMENLSGTNTETASELTQEEMEEKGNQMIESFFEGNENMHAFELIQILFSSLHGLPDEAIGPIIFLLTESPRQAAQEASILFLLHPKKHVREIAIHVLSEIYTKSPLPPESLTRLITIRQWSPSAEHEAIDSLITIQRKLNAKFSPKKKATDNVKFEASIFDGTGVQMIFFEIQSSNNPRVGGFLVKHAVGIRDAWLSPLNTPKSEINNVKEAIQSDINLPIFEVDAAYVSRIASHYIALNNANGETPEPDLLEIYECLGLNDWHSESTNFETLLSSLMKEISQEPPSKTWLKESFTRSEEWMEPYGPTGSWFETSNTIDALINRHTSIHEGQKQISFEKALDELSNTVFEDFRDKWSELFTWMSLVMKLTSEEDELFLWFDFATLAYAINQGYPLADIPLMQHMMHDSLAISMDSVQERGNQLHAIMA